MKKSITIVAFCLTSVAFGSVASAQLRYLPQVTFLGPTQLRLEPVIRPVATRPAVRVSTPSIATRAAVRVSARTVQPAPDPAPAPARFDCRVEENGAWAPATFVAWRDGQRVASGRCGSTVSLEPGSYDVVLTLDGALDTPSRRVRVEAAEGQPVRATARFDTSILEVRFTKDGRRAAGMAIVLRDGQRVGTLGSGVPAHLSSGRYEIVARYRTEERRFTVDLAPEQRRAIRAAF